MGTTIRVAGAVAVFVLCLAAVPFDFVAATCTDDRERVVGDSTASISTGSSECRDDSGFGYYETRTSYVAAAEGGRDLIVVGVAQTKFGIQLGAHGWSDVEWRDAEMRLSYADYWARARAGTVEERWAPSSGPSSCGWGSKAEFVLVTPDRWDRLAIGFAELPCDGAHRFDEILLP